ncbi:MAG: hypothetical protein ACOX5K_08780 [Bacteroidales bacterium]|jgi:hypothetical protein
MKNILSPLLIIIFGVLSCSEKTLIEDQINNVSDRINNISPCLPVIDDSYNYPIRPGSEEWINLKSMNDAYAMCQIPGDEIGKISSKGLILSFLDVPLTLKALYGISSGSPLSIWSGIFDKFNSITELLTRDDAASSLVSFYDEIDLVCAASSNIEDQLNLSYSINALNYLFSSKEVLTQLDINGMKNLVNILVEKYKQIETFPSSAISEFGSLFAMAYVMYWNQFPPIVEYFSDDVERLIQDGLIFEDDIDIIVLSANNFIE